MPSNQRISPWKPTRDRQDFSEELYLNVTYGGDGLSNLSPPGGNLYRVSAHTTAGYFELPNYMNNGIAGQLLDKDPNHLCGMDCESEGTSDEINGPPDIYHRDPSLDNKLRRKIINENTNASLALSTVFNKGPLLTVAMALFGEGSFLYTRINHPTAYWGINRSNHDLSDKTPTNSGACIDLTPMGTLMADPLGHIEAGNGVDACIQNTSGGEGGINLDYELMDWIDDFRYTPERLQNAFTASLILANQAWIFDHMDLGKHSLSVSYDLGADTGRRRS